MNFIPVYPTLCLGGGRSLLHSLAPRQFRTSSSHVFRRHQTAILPSRTTRVRRHWDEHVYQRRQYIQGRASEGLQTIKGKEVIDSRHTSKSEDEIEFNQVKDVFSRVSNELGLNETQVSHLFKLTDLLKEANQEYNLTAIRTRTGILYKHVVDGLCLIPLLDILHGRQQRCTLIDVGSGAGLPGLVIGIARPNIQVTLLEATRKKTEFHQLVIDTLGLQNVCTLWKRAEDAGRDVNHRQMYDVCVARAVARLCTLVELTVPFVQRNGFVIAQKSLDQEYSEVSQARVALESLGASVEQVLDGWPSTFGAPLDDVDQGDAETRRENTSDERMKKIVMIRKVKDTKTRYPRKTGTPSKNPLL